MRSFRSLFLGLYSGLALGLVLTAAGPALAQTSEAREMDDAVTHAYAQGTAGPASIPIRDLATLKLPKDYVFVPAAAGRRLMHGMGNGAGEALIGLVVPSQYTSWFIVVEVLDTGHVDQKALAALDHEEIRGAIAASTRRGNEGEAQIAICDSGVGIDDNAQKHLFKTFFTGFDVSRHSSGQFEFGRQGFGLGLSLAKAFVEMHGGRVEVESQPGKGSTFTIVLPKNSETISRSLTFSV